MTRLSNHAQGEVRSGVVHEAHDPMDVFPFAAASAAATASAAVSVAAASAAVAKGPKGMVRSRSR